MERDPLRCRFYERRYPEIEEVVMVTVTEIGEMGAYVTLLEYDDIEVLIHLLSTFSLTAVWSNYNEEYDMVRIYDTDEKA